MEELLRNRLEDLELDSVIEIVDEEDHHIYITRSAYQFSIMIDDKWFYSNDVREVIRIVREHTRGEISIILD